MKMTRLLAVATLALSLVAAKFSAEWMLVSNVDGWMVIDRLPMRDCGAAKNCRNRWQLLSSDQNLCCVYRNKAMALKAMGDLQAGISWEIATLSGIVC